MYVCLSVCKFASMHVYMLSSAARQTIAKKRGRGRSSKKIAQVQSSQPWDFKAANGSLYLMLDTRYSIREIRSD